MSDRHPPPSDSIAEARMLLDEALGADEDLKAALLARMEALVGANPDLPDLVECLARAQASITEDGDSLEAEGALARLRRLVAEHPDLEEPRRQLCFALFNRYCDEGLDTYLAELRITAEPLPDRDDLMGPMAVAGYSDDD
jgi:hypothetical protein